MCNHLPVHIPGNCPPAVNVEPHPNGWFGIVPPPSLPTATTVTVDTLTFLSPPCAGCGYAYLTGAANPMHPHNPVECAAFKRGFEAGKAAAEAAK